MKFKVLVCFAALSLSVAACRKGPEAQAAKAATPQGLGTPAASGVPAPQPGQAGQPGQPATPPAPPKPVPTQLPEVVARVNGENVTKGDFERMLKTIEARAGQPIPAERRDEIVRGALDQLITYTLLAQESKARGIKIEDAEIEAKMGELKKQFPTQEAFDKALKERGMTVESLRKDARVDLSVNKLMDTEVATLPGPSDADAKGFYEKNPDNFKEQESVRASHILIRVDEKADAAAKQKARAEIESVLKQVKAGGDFAKLAQEHSQDGSAAQGGDLNYFNKGQMVPAFDKVAFELKPGQVSDLVKTQYGFHIIKVVDKQAGATQPLDQVRAQIQQTLAAELADRQITDRARELAARIKSPADMDKAASELMLKVEESGFFQKTDPVPGLGNAPQVADAAFQLQENAVSEPLSSTRGPVFVTVTARKDAYTPKLDEVKDRVREDLIRARATELSRQRAAAIAAQLKSAKDFAAAAKALGLESKDSDLVGRDSALPEVGVSRDVDKVVFALPKGAVSDPIQAQNATVIVRVADRDDVTPDELKLAKERFRAELLNERRGRFFASYMTKAKEQVKVEIKTDVLRRLMDAQRI